MKQNFYIEESHRYDVPTKVVKHIAPLSMEDVLILKNKFMKWATKAYKVDEEDILVTNFTFPTITVKITLPKNEHIS